MAAKTVVSEIKVTIEELSYVQDFIKNNRGSSIQISLLVALVKLRREHLEYQEQEKQHETQKIFFDDELSMRARKVLRQSGVTTLEDLTRQTEGDLLAINNCGQTSLMEIKSMLRKRGLSLASCK